VHGLASALHGTLQCTRMTSAKWLTIGCATLAFACAGAQKQPATATTEASSGPDEAAASQGSGKTGIQYEGGDGSSCQQAIAIVGARGEQDGVASEYTWIKQHYPGAKLDQQSLIDCNGAPTDKMAIETADGQKVTLFFDLSRFFGKL